MSSPKVQGEVVAGNVEYQLASDRSVKLGGIAALTGASTAVAGATLAIPVTHRIALKTTGGAEALTLADGVPGQRITIVLVDDGGTGTLTPATCTGFATIVFADVGDAATLEYVDDTVGWVLVGTYGVAAPPATSQPA